MEHVGVELRHAVRLGPGRQEARGTILPHVVRDGADRHVGVVSTGGPARVQRSLSVAHAGHWRSLADITDLATWAAVRITTARSLHTVRRSRYARLSAIFDGTTFSTYARSGSANLPSVAASSAQASDAGSVSPGRVRRIARCAGVYRAT